MGLAVPLAAQKARTPEKRPDKRDSESFFTGEHIGSLRHGLSAVEVRRLLGRPEQVQAGGRTEDWHYPRQGIFLIMERDAMGSWVHGIVARAPCNMKTAKDVTIGTPFAELRARYPNWTHPATLKDDWVWAGDIKAGLGFQIVGGRVFRIVLGAAPPESLEPLLQGR